MLRGNDGRRPSPGTLPTLASELCLKAKGGAASVVGWEYVRIREGTEVGGGIGSLARLPIKKECIIDAL